jgi:hypothetical protein
MVRQNHCSSCAGSGVCARCGGWGRRWSTFHGRTHREPCPHCSGVGACGLCDGRGRRLVRHEESGAVWSGWRWTGWLWPFAVGGLR